MWWIAPEQPTTVVRDLATLADRLGLDAAQAAFDDASRIVEQTLGAQHPQVAFVLNNLAGLAFERRDFAAARELLERGLAIYEAALGPHHSSTELLRQNLAAMSEG